MYPEKPRSNVWFLLPIFLGIIGGLVAYFIIRKDDPRKAKQCLILGIILALIGIGLNIVLAGQLSGIEKEFGVNV